MVDVAEKESGQYNNSFSRFASFYENGGTQRARGALLRKLRWQERSVGQRAVSIARRGQESFGSEKYWENAP
ncbi:hypothetical protein BM221_007415 [Beauveria bassiana]|uniref:Uncharacterized protein n=1 Tax=Beauveria bassiana TaxID=176275 RepID=A0A2N6NGT3_BEABA|nr:hypothetical protein BM221_007415 [Beauveria bassiana]